MEEVLEEEVMVTCPRCGDNEVPEGDDTCSNCEDWIPCERCGAYHEANQVVDGVNWCDRCTDYNAFTCRRCDVNTTTTHTVDGDEWCQSCWENAHSCEECEASFASANSLTEIQSGEYICGECLENGRVFSWCENREDYHRATHDCECGCRSGTASRTDTSNRGVAGYGCHGEFKIKNSYGKSPVFGLEMEVGNYPDRQHRDNMVAEFYKKLGWEFAYPTSDSSLGNYGIEFIGHPLSALDHVGDERYDIFFQQLINSRAYCNQNSSGCHMTTDRSAFKSDDAIRAALAVVKRFESSLLLFTESRTREARKGYAYSSWDCSKDPIRGAQNIGKYSAVNVNKTTLIEFRIPGMQLDLKRHLAQIQLYHNLMSWCNWVTNWKDAGKASFADIFLPVMYQDSIQDVIDSGLSMAEMEFNPIAPHILTNTGVGGGLTIGTIGGVPAAYVDGIKPTDVDHLVNHGQTRTIKAGDIIYSRESRRMGIALDYANAYSSVVLVSRSGNATIQSRDIYVGGKTHVFSATFAKCALVCLRDYRNERDGYVSVPPPPPGTVIEVANCQIIRAGDYIYKDGLWKMSVNSRNNNGNDVFRLIPFQGDRYEVGERLGSWVQLDVTEHPEYFRCNQREPSFTAFELFVTNYDMLQRFEGGMYLDCSTLAFNASGRIEADPEKFFAAGNGIVIDYENGTVRVGRKFRDSEQCLYPRQSCSLVIGDLTVTTVMSHKIVITFYRRGERCGSVENNVFAPSDYKFGKVSFRDTYKRSSVENLPRYSVSGVSAMSFVPDTIPMMNTFMSRVDFRAVRYGDIVLSARMAFIIDSMGSSSR